MPKLWSETIQAHRRDVGDAILETAATLAAEHGVRGVTMSGIAERTGIGRATLYKYFPDVEAILLEWHRRRVAAHLARLAGVRDAAPDPAALVAAVLGAYAQIVHERAGRRAGPDVTTLVHRPEHMGGVRAQLHRLVRDVLADGAASGDVRADVPVDELATYALGALDAAASLRSRAAAERLVTVTLAGLRPLRTAEAGRPQIGSRSAS
ncbi:MAG TPA: helix-turn-helix domain-containing protein [Candidatus Dormibacteraeota bacterium]|nr:helix-turn-helix domain-containing protein [Candidatus Dormibacteraeota bacterium]